MTMTHLSSNKFTISSLSSSFLHAQCRAVSPILSITWGSEVLQIEHCNLTIVETNTTSRHTQYLFAKTYLLLCQGVAEQLSSSHGELPNVELFLQVLLLCNDWHLAFFLAAIFVQLFHFLFWWPVSPCECCREYTCDICTSLAVNASYLIMVKISLTNHTKNLVTTYLHDIPLAQNYWVE